MNSNIFQGLFINVSTDYKGPIHLDAMSLIGAVIAGATVLISFGAVIGKISPLQIVIMTIMEVFFYSVNLHVFLSDVVHITDRK